MFGVIGARRVGVLLAIVAVVAVASVLMTRFADRMGGSVPCVQAYERARTAADTALVDGKTSARGGRRGGRYTCEDLRRTGQLRR